MVPDPVAPSPIVVDVVWDGGTHGTALARTGRRVTVGHDADWTADDLLGLAVVGSAMHHFLELARDSGLGVSAYIGSASVEVAPDGSRRLVLSPCVMVARHEDVAATLQLLARATAEAPMLAWVALPVEVRPHVHPPHDNGHHVSRPQGPPDHERHD